MYEVELQKFLQVQELRKLSFRKAATLRGEQATDGAFQRNAVVYLAPLCGEEKQWDIYFTRVLTKTYPIGHFFSEKYKRVNDFGNP